jgi:alpha-glucosidase (family GH31 glycosyl hydrolase)
MQYHAEYNFHRRPSNDRTPWNLAALTGDQRVVPAYRALAELRERLVPYLIDQAQAAVTESRPLMRALAFEWPDDDRAWAFSFQYLLGDDLLVAPIVEPGTEWLTVYLPDGEWTDAWSGAVERGPSMVEREVPLGSIAVFTRNWPAARVRAVFG